jgi:hypothetical protein
MVKTDMGGDQAPLTAETSVEVLAVLTRATPEDAGRFYQYDGREIPGRDAACASSEAVRRTPDRPVLTVSGAGAQITFSTFK